jgi:hypothetical protein
VIPTVRSNGVLLAQPTPTGGLISGESSVVQLDAWNWEDAAYKKDVAIHLTGLTEGWWWPWRWFSPWCGNRTGPQETPAERAQKALDAITPCLWRQRLTLK